MATILIIDDETSVATLLAELLDEEGYSVVIAFDGSDGLARARAVRPDLILSDVMMPGLDGYALVQAIAADPDLQDTPIVLMSAGPAGPKAAALPVAGFISKPFLLDHVVTLIQHLLT